MILAILAAGGAAMLTVFSMLTESIRGELIGAVLVSCGVCGVIAMAIFTKDVSGSNSNGFDYGWSYALGWVGSIAAFLSSVTAFIFK